MSSTIRKWHSIRAQLWQHPVGQGFLHSGVIKRRGCPDFRYVYDCGKWKARDEEWSRILAPMSLAYGAAPLDAVFISHFDQDHVNGLSNLLQRFSGARYVFLPYLRPPTRLILGVRQDERGGRGEDGYADYLNFLSNPAAWLTDRGVDRVVYVGGGNRGDQDPQPIVPDFPWEPPNQKLLVRDRDTPESLFAVAEADRARTPASVRYMDHRQPVLLHAGVPGALSGWVFQTHVFQDWLAERCVSSAVESALGPNAYTVLCEGRADCAQILGVKSQRNRLAKAYRAGLGSRARERKKWKELVVPGARTSRADRSWMNRSTLSLFSGPWRTSKESSILHHLTSPRVAKHILPFRAVSTEPTYHRWTERSVARHGWLLTGDAVLRDAVVLNAFCRFYGAQRDTSFLARTLVFTAPHHGSKANMSQEVYEALERPPIAVVPAGRREYFGHPSDEVMEMLTRSCLSVEHLHSGTGRGFRHSMVVDVRVKAPQSWYSQVDKL